MDIFTIFISIFLVYLIVDLALAYLNLKFLENNRAEVPSYFTSYIDLDTYLKSVEYTRVRGRFGIITILYSALVTLIIIASGFLGTFDQQIKIFHLDIRLHGIAYILLISILFSLLEAPFDIYRTFVIEERFGFNKTTFKVWVIDLIKGYLLQILILTPILWATFWFIQASGTYWWIYAFIFMATVQLLLQFLFPVMIAPLFNKFTTLPDGPLRDKIEHLASKLEFKTCGIYLMDGSKRSAHANAYFTGFGANKRIVLYDTLINTLTDEEVVAVLAHEIGHQKKHHVFKLTFISMLMLLIGLWSISLLIPYLPMYYAFGFNEPSSHAALIIFSMLAAPVGFFLTPIISILSRRHEYEADRYAAQAVSSGQALSSALLALSKKSLSNLTPHPLYSFFHYSHPTLMERLVALEKFNEIK